MSVGNKVDDLLSLLDGVHKIKGGWSARCPAHKDGRASLSIAEGDNGGAVLYCHAGCEQAAVVAAIGLSLADLVPDGPATVSTSTKPSQTQKKPGNRRQDNGQPQGKAYPTARDAVAALEQQHDKRSALWTYRDVGGRNGGH